MRVFITADTHHGIQPAFEPLTFELARWCLAEAAAGDVLLLGGDLACADGKGLHDLLEAFAAFPGPKGFVPGNHDLWSDPGRGIGSDRLYEEALPAAARQHGYVLLDRGPLRAPLPGGGALGVAGSFGGFDMSLAALGPLAREERAEVERAWETGAFRHAFWNDYRYTWRSAAGGPGGWDHAGFARACAQRLGEHLQDLEADAEVRAVVCVTHTGAILEEIQDHPAGEHRPLAGNLWFRGLSGSAALGDAVRRSPKTRLHACGHTHHERRHEDDAERLWINVGCDYPRKRFLVYDVAAGQAAFGPWFEAPR